MPGNPYWNAGVKTLLHFNGADNGTTITCAKGKTWTAYGNARTKTGTKKYGAAALFCDGSGDYVKTAASADWLFGTDPLTVEGWVYIVDHSAVDGSGWRVAQICSNLSGSGGGFAAMILGDGSATGTGLRWEDKYGGSATGGNAVGTISHNQWHHVCWCREGGTIYMGLDGAILGTSSISTGRNLGSSSTELWVGGQNVSSWAHYLNGYLDDFQVIKGAAIYKDAYQPPPAELPEYDRYSAGNITESTPHTDWIVRAHRLDTGALIAEVNVTGASYELPCMVGGTGYVNPIVTWIIQKCGSLWSAAAAKLAGDYAIPTDPESTPYVFECTTGGTTGDTEPNWDTTPGNTTNDGSAVWTCKGRMVAPRMQGPLIARI